MMSTKKRLVKAAGAITLCVLAAALHTDAQAADSIVPTEWNVGPMRSGAYLEAFDGALPAWAAGIGFSAVTNVFPDMSGSGLPIRSNVWFDANVKVLQLETDGNVVTNTVAYTNGPVTFASQPVYVDVRIKFDPLVNTPEQEMLDNSKMALFLTSDAKLVVVHDGGASTNGTALDTNKWHQVTVKLENGTFDVLLNDAVVFSDLTLKNVGAANTLASANFYGTGLLDELYVSHGNPAYLVPGPTSAIPELPPAGPNPPSDEEQTMINAWLSGYAGITSGTALNMTQDQLSMAYLLDELGGDETEATAVAYSFGIAKIDMNSPDSLVVTLALKVDDAEKEGAINGKIQLQGKVDIDDGWTLLDGAITPAFADFEGGLATYTFNIPAGGHKFFKPLIVP